MRIGNCELLFYLSLDSLLVAGFLFVGFLPVAPLARLVASVVGPILLGACVIAIARPAMLATNKGLPRFYGPTMLATASREGAHVHVKQHAPTHKRHPRPSGAYRG